MQLDIILPEKTLFSAEAEMVVVPGTEGDFGVLSGHAPFISTIRPGVLTIDTADGKQQRIAIMGGIAEVVPERCTILAETALDCSTLTAEDAQTRLADARTELEDSTDEPARRTALKKLAFAEAVKSAVGQ